MSTGDFRSPLLQKKDIPQVFVDIDNTRLSCGSNLQQSSLCFSKIPFNDQQFVCGSVSWYLSGPIHVESPNTDRYIKTLPPSPHYSLIETAYYLCYLQIHPAGSCINHNFIVLYLSEKPRAWNNQMRGLIIELWLWIQQVYLAAPVIRNRGKVISFLRHLLSSILESGRERLCRHLEWGIHEPGGPRLAGLSSHLWPGQDHAGHGWAVRSLDSSRRLCPQPWHLFVHERFTRDDRANRFYLCSRKKTFDRSLTTNHSCRLSSEDLIWTWTSSSLSSMGEPVLHHPLPPYAWLAWFSHGRMLKSTLVTLIPSLWNPLKYQRKTYIQIQIRARLLSLRPHSSLWVAHQELKV